jgi:cysteine-rich repeat protein
MGSTSSTASAGGMGGMGSTSSTASAGGMGGMGGAASSGSTGGAMSTGGTSGTGGAPVCGDGVTEGAEQCDFGAANGPKTGCETSCVFSCTKGPDSCPDAEMCNGVESCTTVMSGTSTGQKCMPGVQLLDCSSCASGVCGSGVCKASTCGDGCIDASKGEQCEPPGTVMCDATCKTAVASTCGDGVRQANEQCDDANTVNLDGCDASCKFEQDLRSHFLKMQFGVDAFCGNANKLGGAISAAVAQSQVQANIDQGIGVGSTGFVVKMLGLDSLVGGNDPMLDVGVMRALPVAGAGYTGSNDLEWWYTVNAATIDASRSPLDKLTGSIAANTLTAGPGSMSMAVNFFQSSATVLRLSSAKLQVSVGASSAPGSSVGGMTPGHLPSEHLDPALQSFSHLAQANISFSGKLCGDISARSFSQAPIPPELLPTGGLPCSEGYTAANSFLDVIVFGCTVNLGIPVLAIAASQPDKANPVAPMGGAGAPYKLNVNAQKMVTTCSDKDNVAVGLDTCLDAAAYSSFFRFAMDRVILK